jgi:hypothetical protein
MKERPRRHPDQVLRRPDGQIIDNGGKLLGLMATELVRRHDQAVLHQTSSKLLADESRRSFFRGADVLTRAKQSGAKNKDITDIRERVDHVTERFKDQTAAMEEANRDRKAALWDSQQHYEANELGYQQLALDEAITYGKEINISYLTPTVEIEHATEVELAPVLEIDSSRN